MSDSREETKARARVAVCMIEAVMRMIDQIYTESAKGSKVDILPELTTAKRNLEIAQQRQLRLYDSGRPTAPEVGHE